jgi:photosynthetic reaction center cytochrome c subunit
MCLLVCGAVIRSARAQSPASAQAAATAPGPKKAEEQFKNIQTLKGIPGDQVIPTMQFISASLGVECDFCHVQGAFEKDDKKPKQTARKMMDMMFAINKDNFEGHREVTCYSCHRGSTDPVATPLIATEEAKAQPEAKKAEGPDISGPSANELFDKYVQALGGSASIDRITSRVAKGTVDFAGKQLPVDVYSKGPDKRASFIHLPEGENVTAFDGHEGWMGTPGRPIREMHGSDVDDAAMDADLHFATHLKQMFTEAQVRGIEKAGGHDAYVVVGRREGKPPVRLYFDTQSGLLVRLVRYAETALGRLPTQIDYVDYRDADGVKIPFRWTLARPSGRFTIQISEVKQNVAVDDTKFAKPPAPASEAKAPSK